MMKTTIYSIVLIAGLVAVSTTVGQENEAALLNDLAKVVVEVSTTAGKELAGKWKKNISLDKESVNMYLSQVVEEHLVKTEPIIIKLAVISRPTPAAKEDRGGESNQAYDVIKTLTSTYLKELTLERAKQLTSDNIFNGTVTFSKNTEENNILATLSRTLAEEPSKTDTNVMLKKVDEEMKKLVTMLGDGTDHKSGLQTRSLGHLSTAEAMRSYQLAKRFSREIGNTITTSRTFLTDSGSIQTVSETMNVDPRDINTQNQFFNTLGQTGYQPIKSIDNYRRTYGIGSGFQGNSDVNIYGTAGGRYEYNKYGTDPYSSQGSSSNSLFKNPFGRYNSNSGNSYGMGFPGSSGMNIYGNSGRRNAYENYGSNGLSGQDRSISAFGRYSDNAGGSRGFGSSLLENPGRNQGGYFY